MAAENIDYIEETRVIDGWSGNFTVIELLQYTKPSHDVMGKDFIFSFEQDFPTALTIHTCLIRQGISISLILNGSNDPRFLIQSVQEGRFESSKMAVQGANVVFWVEQQGQNQTMWLTLNQTAAEDLRAQMASALIEFNSWWEQSQPLRLVGRIKAFFRN